MKPVTTKWNKRRQALILLGLTAGLAVSGCVKKSKYDALQRRYDKSRQQANSCGQQLNNQVVAVQALKYARAQTAQQLAASNADRQSLRGALEQLQRSAGHSAARETQYRRQLARLTSIMEKHAKVFRLQARNLVAGLPGLGLRKGQRPGNRLRPHLYASREGEMDLAPSARVQVDGVRFDRLTLALKDGKLTEFILAVSRSGDEKVGKLQKILKAICRHKGPKLWRHGPAPGTPQPGPFGVSRPLAVLSKASCEAKVPPWHLEVDAEHSQASKRMDLLLRFHSKKP